MNMVLKPHFALLLVCLGQGPKAGEPRTADASATNVAIQSDGIRWVSVTNGVMTGARLWPRHADSRPLQDERLLCVVYLTYGGTGAPPRVVRPAREQRFTVDLWTSDQHPVKRTAMGKRTGRLPPQGIHYSKVDPRRWWIRWPSATAGWQQVGVLSGLRSEWAHFDVAELFQIPEPGTYRLVIKPHILAADSEGKLNLLEPRPSLELTFEARYADLEGP